MSMSSWPLIIESALNCKGVIMSTNDGPVIAAKKPVKVSVEAGKDYF
ncbi:MAG: hypothetical protein AB8B63_06805 [Granulosicoccus sp.]